MQIDAYNTVLTQVLFKHYFALIYYKM